MGNAPIDDNSRQAATALLSTDGATITTVLANPTNHGIEVNDGTTGSDHGGTHGYVDDNSRTTLFVESSAGDGALVALYVTSGGHLLINSM